MTDTSIAFIHARRVWDSRGRPTVEADVLLEGGAVGRAIAPAGASTGSAEAVDLRDGGPAFGGYDVTQAVSHVNGIIAHAVIGMDAADQEALDERLMELDGTRNKGRLGANATLSVSMAAAHAAAAAAGQPLYRYLGGPDAALIPLPQIQIFGGGAHAGRRVDIQDFMVMCPAAASFGQALDWTAEVYRSAGLLMAEAGSGRRRRRGRLVAGFRHQRGCPGHSGPRHRARRLPARRAGGDRARHRCLGVPPRRRLPHGAGRHANSTSDGMVELLTGWIGRYPILSIEDPLAEDDLDGLVAFTRAVGDRVQIVGDDLFVTDADRLREAAARGAGNCVLLKPNQRGTLTEALDARRAAQDAGYATIVSARSGETEDVTIAHLAVGWGAGQLKVGSFSRGERMAKWNEVLRIEEALGGKARFAGGAVLGRSGAERPGGERPGSSG